MIERLALDLVVPGDEREQATSKVVEALLAIEREARSAGRPDVAELAGSAVAPVQQAISCGGEWNSVEAGLQDALLGLQRALANEQGGEPAPAPPPPAAALADDPELINDFVLKTSEHIVSIEARLLTLEQDPNDNDAIHSVFRSFHTVKGLAGFLEFHDIREVAHDVENILDLARNGEMRITPAVIDVVLASTDFLKLSVEALQDRINGRVGTMPAHPAALLVEIRQLRSSGAPSDAAVMPAPVSPVKTVEEVPEQSVAPVSVSQSPAAVSNAPAATPRVPVAETGKKTRSGEARTVKVDTAKLDAMVDMVGEMVIAQSMVRHDPDLSGLRTPRLLRNLSQLARTTDELQKTAMSMRMVPVGQLFQKMARLTRDLARKSGKQVELETSGEETELDRNLVEELADALMHMIRNSVDHGMETVEEREAAGKSPVGRIELRASHQAGLIVIEVRDDGRGLNRARILEKAREKHLIDGTSNLSDSDVHNLIFRPGFSTAEKVTDVSGRGVGMDVVRKQIQKLRGRVEIRSKQGEGTTFTLMLPLTLAIIEGLVVGVGPERYIVPLYSVREVLRPNEDTISTIEGRAEVALVRDRLLPVVRLYQRFGVVPKNEDPCQCVLVISESGGKAFGLMVDELIGKQEVVIKSLGETLKNIDGVAGGAILGDGRVGLVLDVEGVFRAREALADA